MRKAIIWGFGALGRTIARTCLEEGDIAVAGVVDRAAELAGLPADAIVPGLAAGLSVRESLAGVADAGADLVFHATQSEPRAVSAQIIAAVTAGYDVVTAAEWMFHPWLRHGEFAGPIAEAARAHGRRVVGCGINPGFCFETLPLILARTLGRARKLEAMRVADVSGIGPSDFAHLGFGLTAAAFRERLADGSIKGHIGFPESMAALAERSGFAIDRIVEHWWPTLAERPLQLAHTRVETGGVIGISQEAVGEIAGEPRIRMVLEMFLDPAGYGRRPRETVIIEAGRTVTLTVEPSAPPTEGAAAMMVQAARLLDRQASGIVSLLDLAVAGPARLASPLRATGTTFEEGGVVIRLASP